MGCLGQYCKTLDVVVQLVSPFKKHLLTFFITEHSFEASCRFKPILLGRAKCSACISFTMSFFFFQHPFLIYVKLIIINLNFICRVITEWGLGWLINSLNNNVLN